MAATTPIPDIVRVSKLVTEFLSDPECTQHVKHISDSTKKQRRVRKEERWKGEKQIGRGGFGSVWLERCIHGHNKGELRAVKKITKLEGCNYYRELEAIALFSHSQVRLLPALTFCVSFCKPHSNLHLV